MRSLIALVCLLVLATIFAPTLASTSLARRFALSRINHHIQGTLDIADWSFHWTGGIRLHGLCLYDQQHQPVVTIDDLRTQLSLRDALHSQFHCGETEIDGLNLVNLVIHKNGSTNLEELLKSEPTSPTTHATHTTRTSHRTTTATVHPHDIPIVSGDFHINGFKGTITHDRLKGPIILDPSDIDVNITDLVQPMTQTGHVTLRMQPFASNDTITWKGRVQLIDGQRVDMAASQIEATVAFDHFEGGGFTLEQSDVPLKLDGGILRATPKDPLVCNGGKLNLAGLVVDWKTGTPRLNTPADYALVTGASINPLLGDSLGKFVNPIFPNSSRAEGKLDVTLKDCTNVALNDAIKTSDSGALTAIFSIHDMQIVNPLGSQMVSEVRKSSGVDVGKLLGMKTSKKSGTAKDADLFAGQIDNGTVTLEQGRINEDITLQLIEPATASGAVQPMVLRFVGQVKLHDQSQKLDVTVPPHFVSRSLGNKQFAELLADLFPEGIPISLRGTTKSPKLDISRSVGRYHTKSKDDRPGKDDAQKLGDLINQLAQPPKHHSHGTSRPATEPSSN
jgi:hypothetical protein